MYVELIDALRCPRAHPGDAGDTWLVAASRHSVGRSIVEGFLGCPVCRAEYPIRGGVVDFGGSSIADADPAAVRRPLAPSPDPEAAFRLAALLHLATAGGIIALGGAWDGVADALAPLTDARVLLLDPAHTFVPREPVGALVGADLPVSAGALRGVALDAATATPARVLAAVRALRAGGRLVAPVSVTVPPNTRELARDDQHWVAERLVEREAVPAVLVPLRRAVTTDD